MKESLHLLSCLTENARRDPSTGQGLTPDFVNGVTTVSQNLVDGVIRQHLVYTF